MTTRVRLVLRHQPRLPQVCGRCGRELDMLTEQGAEPGRGYGCFYPILGGYPMLGVAPGRAGQHRMWLGNMVRLGRLDGVGGVEVGVESERVVGVALQGSDAVM